MIPSRRRTPHSREGFTLIEIVVVLFIIGVVISMAAMLTRGVTAAQKRSITSSRLAIVDAALVQFVQQQRRLPCPADGTRPGIATSAPIPGDEGPRTAAGCTAVAGNYETNGVVPWRMLGLSETDATDGWDHRITYRIDPQLGADNGVMDMSSCDPAGGGAAQVTNGINYCNSQIVPPTSACTASLLTNCTPPSTYLNNKGLRVKNIAGTVLMEPSPAAGIPSTGAAYVLVSHGETGGGGYLNSGVLGASTVADGTEERKNYASLPFVTQVVTYYVDDTTNETSGATHFDDVVLRPSVMNVITRAGLGPRPHL